MPTAFVLGIDRAVQPEKIGIALAELRRPLRFDVLRAGERGEDAAEVAAELLAGCDAALIALNAPLGWPIPLGSALGDHEAGAALEAPANQLFRRKTDDVIAREFGKRPLDVGADRIARTADAALRLLGDLRLRLGEAIPLAWSPVSVTGIQAIEVYPAATLASRGLKSRGYKGKVGVQQQTEIARALMERGEFAAASTERVVESDHVMDAALCCLAGLDFVEGDVVPVEEEATARREGWFWVQRS